MKNPPKRPNPIADDGDEFRFCSTCAFSAACLESGYGKPELRELHVLVEHIGPFKEGEHIFREGDEFNAIAAVRGGREATALRFIELVASSHGQDILARYGFQPMAGR